jgi:hypothetical protein
MDCAVAARQVRRSLRFFGTSSIAQPARYILRILHYSLSTLFAATVLFVVAGAEAQTQKGSACGIIYLLRSNRVNSPSLDLAKEPCWTNPHVQGVLLRTQWNKIQPREEAIDWSFFDEGVALAAKYNKKLGLLITAGVTTPQWVYSAGASEFTVTTARGPRSPMPLPWDPVFQAKWGNVIRTFAARYDSNPQVVYVVMSGSGRKAESFFVSNLGDIDAFERLGGLTSWKTGVKWITDEYAKHFSATPFLLDLGAPVPSTQGRAALADVCDYAVAAYPHRFGVRSDGLSANYNLNSVGAKEVAALSGTTTVGFQMSVPSKGRLNPQGDSLLAGALNRGIGLGAHFIEVYAVDCNEPRNAQVLTQAADKLKKVVQHGNASSGAR